MIRTYLVAGKRVLAQRQTEFGEELGRYNLVMNPKQTEDGNLTARRLGDEEGTNAYDMIRQQNSVWIYDYVVGKVVIDENHDRQPIIPLDLEAAELTLKEVKADIPDAELLFFSKLEGSLL